MRARALGKVYLAGAGPGDPELLTMRAAALLAQADLVLHDDLVSSAILQLAGKASSVMSVGKRCGKKKVTQEEIHELMISAARRGLMVMRLKSGDPLIFGRAAEEMEALRAAAIPFEIVPGVTAVCAAAASLHVSLTDRRIASRLIVVSGHPAAAEDLEKSFASLPKDSTLAVYMPGPDLGRVAAALLASGLSGATPCAVARRVTRPGASFHLCRLTALGALQPDSGPGLLLLGESLEAAFAAKKRRPRRAPILRSAPLRS